MNYSAEEVKQYIQEEDVRFIRLTFSDVFGRLKTISILPAELNRAFKHGIAIDASAITGFGDGVRSDLVLRPCPETTMPLPWRPEHGRVVRMFCNITNPDGTAFICDTRQLLDRAVKDAKKAGLRFCFGAEQEFYLFKLDQNGEPTTIPYDKAGYMDMPPEDKCENLRLEICNTLELMGIHPESLHHEEGPGQNEIDFHCADPLTVADHTLSFRAIVKMVADRNGMFADFSPKPLADKPGNGFHINMSVKADDGSDKLLDMISGILDKTPDMTAFLNPTERSYTRFGHNKAPGYISWSSENRSQLVRVPAAEGKYRRAELRSPDPTANPYLAFTLIIYAAMYGIEQKPALPPAADINLYKADLKTLSAFKPLPQDLKTACAIAAESEFIRRYIPEEIRDIYCKR